MGIKKALVLDADHDHTSETYNNSILSKNQQLSNKEMQVNYSELMYAGADRRHIAIMVKKKDGAIEHIWTTAEKWLEDVQRAAASGGDCYTSMNTFLRKKRKIEHLWHLNAFFVDLDIYNTNKSVEDVLEAVSRFVAEKKIFPPTMIISSGRGMYLIWKIHDVPGQIPGTRQLYKRIQNYLVELFEEYGGDHAAKDAARVLRIPGTIHTGSGNTVKILDCYKDRIYTMYQFQSHFIDKEGVHRGTVKRAVQRKKQGKQGAELKRFPKPFNIQDPFAKSQISRHKAICDDIEALCENRRYFIAKRKRRNATLHIYAFSLMMVYQNQSTASGFVEQLNALFDEPLEKAEVERIVQSATAAYKDFTDYLQLPEDQRPVLEKYAAPGYHYDHKTIIKYLKITKKEQKRLKTLISPEEKKARKNARERAARRDESGMTKRQANKAYLVERVKELKECGMKQKDIAEMLGITKGTVSKYLKL